MQKHTKVVMEFYGYDISDFIPCFICGKQATEIHHIVPKSRIFGEKRDNIYNLIPICRSDHDKYSAKKYVSFLQRLVKEKIDKINGN
jgi:5-methylcytosine-specific restriction endonuclease McrA